MFFGEIFGPDLLIVIIIIAIVIFGGAAIPKLARSLGSAKSEFEKGIKSGASETSDTPSGEAAPAEKPAANDNPAS